MDIAIVDDEIHWRNIVKAEVEKIYNNKEICIDIFENGKTYLKSKKQYAISFIDIEMPYMDGFQVIECAKEINNEGLYIILTTHTEMSRKGYLVNAFRYIDKANMADEIVEASKAADILLKRNEYIEINIVGEGNQIIRLKDILYIEAEKHCTLFHTRYGNKKSNSTMNEIENNICKGWFYRCHKSFIVNLDEIYKCDGKIIFMKNGDNLDIARRKRAEFNKIYLNRKYECANC